MGKKLASDYERRLANKFWDNGFAVIRAPSSSGTSRMPRPDIFVGSAEKNQMYAIEIKTSRQDTFYVQKEQIDGLTLFSKRMGAKPLLAVKYVGYQMMYRFLRVPEDLVESSGNSYRVNIDYVKEYGLTFTKLVFKK